jgi:hypothetical protein
MATQWLTTEVDSSTSRGSTQNRTITMSGTNTTVKTEDEGVIISFAVILEGGLGKVPDGDSGPPPICPP